MSEAIKTNKIGLMLSDEDKAILEQAAYHQGLSLREYIMTVAVEQQAALDVKGNDAIVLAGRDRDLIVSSSESPNEPNQALKDLFV